MSLSLCRKIVGPVTNSAAGCVNQSFSCSVFGSSATIAFALPSPVAWPGPIAAIERAVRRERDRADDSAAVGLPRHDRLRVAVQIDRPDAVRRAAAVPRRRGVQRRVHGDRRGPPRVGGQERRRALEVLAGRQTEHVQHAVARDHVADAGGPEQKAERAAASSSAARRAGNPLAGLAAARRRQPAAARAVPRRGRRPARRPAAAPRRGGRRRRGIAASASRTGRAPFDRHALRRARRAGCDTRPTPRAAAEPPGRVGGRCDRACTMRVAPAVMPPGHAAVAAGSARVELPLPDDVAEVVVDAVDVVRAAGDERHRHEQRHAARGHALRQAVRAARLVVELRVPLQLEARLRQRRDRDLVVGAHPRRALRIGQRGQPLRAAAADLREARRCRPAAAVEDRRAADVDARITILRLSWRRRSNRATPSNVAMYARPLATVSPLK